MSRCLIYVLRGNTFMAVGTVDQNEQGSATECRIRHASAEYCLAQGHATFIERVWSLRTSSIPVLGGSDPIGPACRSLGDYGADHTQAPRENSAPFASVREKQWADHRIDCDSRVGRVSWYSEKTWLSRAPRTARFKFALTMYLIACTTLSSLRLTAFLCRSESVRLVAA